MEKTQTAFTNFDTLNNICKFLKLKDKLAMGSLNRYMGFLINQHLRMFMKEKALPAIHDKNQRQTLKYYLNRNVRAVKINSILHEGKEDSTHYNFLRGKHIVKIDSGKNFTAFRDYDGKAYFTRTQMLAPKYNNKLKYETALNVKKAFAKASKLHLLHHDGTVTYIEKAANHQEVAGPSHMLQWTRLIPVQDMVASYNYAIFILGSQIKIADIKKRIFMEEYEQDPVLELARQGWIKILCLNFSTNKYNIIKYPYGSLKSFCVGSNMAYFTDNQNKLYHCQLNNVNEGQLDMNVFEVLAFENKSVVKVWSGFNYYIALCRSEYLLEKWDNTRVLQWLKKEGYDDFINIMKAEKVDGRKLLQMDRKYMNDVLGITNSNLQQKMIMSIQKNQQISYSGDQLFGWGLNSSGQLGNNQANFVQKPIKIKLPQFAKNQYIQDICCGWFNTIIKTNQCRLFVSTLGKQLEKQKEKQEVISDQQLKKEIDRQIKKRKKSQIEEKQKEDKKEERTGKKKKQQRKKQQRPPKQDRKKPEEECRWAEYKATRPFVLDSAGDMLFFTQLAYKQEDNKKKIRTAKAIIDKVLWDPNIDKTQFSIGYFDKYMGTLEASIESYQTSEIKQHRVIYLKREGTVVWHREDKIDLL